MANENSYSGITWINERTAKFDGEDDVTIIFAEEDKPDAVNAVLGMLIMSRINQ